MARQPLTVLRRDVLDFSISNTVERCPRKAWGKYVVNRVSNKEDTVSIDIGTAYHKYRETLTNALFQEPDKPDLCHQLALAVALKDFQDPPTTHKKSWLDRTKLRKACELAFEKVMNERKNGRVVIQSESSFDLLLPSGRRWGGKIDEVFEWNRKPWIKDFKFKSWMLTDSDLYALDHQMSGYSWAYYKLNGRLISDVIVEVLYATEKNIVIKPLIATKTKEDHDNFIEWAEESWDRYEKYLTKNVWPMHTSTCFDYMKRCEFFDMCRAGSWANVQDWLESNSQEKIWDFSKGDD